MDGAFSLAVACFIIDMINAFAAWPLLKLLTFGGRGDPILDWYRGVLKLLCPWLPAAAAAVAAVFRPCIGATRLCCAPWVALATALTKLCCLPCTIALRRLVACWPGFRKKAEADAVAFRASLPGRVQVAKDFLWCRGVREKYRVLLERARNGGKVAGEGLDLEKGSPVPGSRRVSIAGAGAAVLVAGVPGFLGGDDDEVETVVLAVGEDPNEPPEARVARERLRALSADLYAKRVDNARRTFTADCRPKGAPLCKACKAVPGAGPNGHNVQWMPHPSPSLRFLEPGSSHLDVTFDVRSTEMDVPLALTLTHCVSAAAAGGPDACLVDVACNGEPLAARMAPEATTARAHVVAEIHPVNLAEGANTVRISLHADALPWSYVLFGVAIGPLGTPVPSFVDSTDATIRPAAKYASADLLHISEDEARGLVCQGVGEDRAPVGDEVAAIAGELKLMHIPTGGEERRAAAAAASAQATAARHKDRRRSRAGRRDSAGGTRRDSSAGAGRRRSLSGEKNVAEVVEVQPGKLGEAGRKKSMVNAIDDAFAGS